ncbi:hypothetical protein [Marinospirillum perlucidum]|uniref:hypothetical protein n=1 Tax=Marinospirillum perlucidum TaxID=1982602 RepID=UPI000DF40258|nr:hypothetical protein [Marinospirillum perlucidum]
MALNTVTAIMEELAEEPSLKNDSAALLKAIILNLHMSPDALREILDHQDVQLASQGAGINVTSNREEPIFIAVGDTNFTVDGATAKDFFDCADLIQNKMNCTEKLAEIAEMVLIQQVQNWFWEREDNKPIPVQGFRPGMVIN